MIYLFEFLENHCNVLEKVSDDSIVGQSASAINKAMLKPFCSNNTKPVSTAGRTSSFFSYKSPTACAFYKSDHSMYSCSAFAERYNHDKSFNCHSSSHDVKSFRSSHACKICSSKKDHTLLLLDNINATSLNPSKATVGSKKCFSIYKPYYVSKYYSTFTIR